MYVHIWHHQASRHPGRPTTPQGPRGSRDRWLSDHLYRTGKLYKELESSYLIHTVHYYCDTTPTATIASATTITTTNTTTTTRCLPSALPSAPSPSIVLNKQPVPPASSPDPVSSRLSCCLLSPQLWRAPVKRVWAIPATTSKWIGVVCRTDGLTVRLLVCSRPHPPLCFHAR